MKSPEPERAGARAAAEAVAGAGEAEILLGASARAPAEPWHTGPWAVALRGREGPERTAPESMDGHLGLDVSGLADSGPERGERLGIPSTCRSATRGQPSPTPSSGLPGPPGRFLFRMETPTTPQGISHLGPPAIFTALVDFWSSWYNAVFLESPAGPRTPLTCPAHPPLSFPHSISWALFGLPSRVGSVPSPLLERLAWESLGLLPPNPHWLSSLWVARISLFPTGAPPEFYPPEPPPPPLGFSARSSFSLLLDPALSPARDPLCLHCLRELEDLGGPAPRLPLRPRRRGSGSTEG